MQTLDYASRPGLPLKDTLRYLVNTHHWILMFISGVVFFEPAPFELLCVASFLVAMICGMKIRLHIMPMVLLLILFCFGGYIAVTQIGISTITDHHWDAFEDVTVTLLLVAVALYFAILVSDNIGHLRILFSGYIFGAAIMSFFSAVAAFGVIPIPILMMDEIRAKGLFEDPNVFAPYLLLPLVYLAANVINSRPNFLLNLALLACVIVGVLVAGSRAGWGIAIGGLGLISLFSLVNAKDLREKTIRIGIGISGFMVLVAGLVGFALLSSTQVLQHRAQLTQQYDTYAQTGRFPNQKRILGMVVEHPLGMGYLAASKITSVDPHNTFLKAAGSYGWLGFFAYLSLLILTCIKLFSITLRPTPWRIAAQSLFTVIVAHVFISMVIDIDHWRHFFVCIGLSWGLIAYDWRSRQINIVA